MNHVCQHVCRACLPTVVLFLVTLSNNTPKHKSYNTIQYMHTCTITGELKVIGNYAYYSTDRIPPQVC